MTELGSIWAISFAIMFVALMMLFCVLATDRWPWERRR